MEIEEDREQLRMLFHACDVNNSGRIEKEDFLKVCSELRVQPIEVDAIFSKLDADRDGSINFEEFSSGFRGVSELVYFGGMESGSGDSYALAWEAFRSRLGEQAALIPRDEQAAILYQNIHLIEPRMLPQYERVIINFIREIKLQNSEMENLALAVKRAQDKATMQLSEMEEEMEERIQATESAVRQQVKALANSDLSSHSSYQDEDCDSLALCDPMRRPSCESCFDSGLSTLRDSNGYDSEADVRKGAHRPAGTAESLAGDASDMDVPDIQEEAAFGPREASVLDWKPSNPISRSSSGTSARKCLSAISAQDDKEEDSSKYMVSDTTYKIVLAGDAAVGKSSFLHRLCKNEFRGNTSATLGVDFQMKTLVVDGEPTVLQLWDTAGQERFRSIAKSYFRRADGVLLLYDVTCEKSFLDVREWVDMIEDVSHEDIPIMLVGNKADLRKQTLEDGIKCVPANYGEKLAMTYNALFCETSAKDGSNVIEAVLHLAREVKRQVHKDKDLVSVTSLTGSHNKKLSNINCCTA
nr:ras and EF-hand domain-containing protein [Paramormyrops kingsleyae]